MKRRKPKDYNTEECGPDPRKEVNERYDNAKLGKIKDGREYLGHDAWRMLDKLELSPRKEP